MRFLSYIAFWCVSAAACFGASVVIYNDSPYPLSATIMSADGKTMKTIMVNPQQQSSWDDPSPPNATYSQTPYTVTFMCKTGGHFGTISGVNQGAWVTASRASNGQGYCKPQKDEQNQQQVPQLVPPSQQKDLELGPP